MGTTRLIVTMRGLLAIAAAAGAFAGAASASPSLHHPAASAAVACRADYYKNVSGHCVHRPAHDSTGATAKCRDGTYSYSEHASGTCSHHGGVARWIHHP